MTTVMSPVVTDRGVRRNDRASHNRKGDKRKQQIAEHLHSEKPLYNPAAQSSGRSEIGITLSPKTQRA